MVALVHALVWWCQYDLLQLLKIKADVADWTQVASCRSLGHWTGPSLAPKGTGTPKKRPENCILWPLLCPCPSGLSLLVKDLNPVAARWHGLGVQLGLDDGELRNISGDGGRVQACFRDMLVEWMNNETPTTAAIIAALRRRTINYCALADELEKMKGCTYKQSSFWNFCRKSHVRGVSVTGEIMHKEKLDYRRNWYKNVVKL